MSHPRAATPWLLRRQQRLRLIPFLVRENMPHGYLLCQSNETNKSTRVVAIFIHPSDLRFVGPWLALRQP